MEKSTGMSKTVGRVGSALGLIGLVLFLVGIFGAPREFAFAGVAMILASFAAFYIEEVGNRRALADAREPGRE